MVAVVAVVVNGKGEDVHSFPQEGELMTRYTRMQKWMGRSAESTIEPRPWTLNARMAAHPIVQAILRGKRSTKTISTT